MSDLISRQDAIDAVNFGIIIAKAIDKESGNVTELFASENEELRKAIKRIEDLPSAQPIADVRENVRGEWIEDNSREKSMMWRCSVCGRIAYYPTIGKRKSYKKHCGYNYCPNCGADMR